jgi:mono/diheme cytochrome c family protein
MQNYQGEQIMTQCSPGTGATWLRAAVAAIFLLIIAPYAVAQEAGDISEGHRLAEKWCVSCHVIAPDSRSGTSNGAPTFTSVARMKSATPMSLRVFLQTPHSRMPDLHLSREEIDDLVAYILSLRDK